MSEQKLRFWRQVEPTPGDVSLVFGDWPGVALRFVTKVQATPGLVSLVFGAQPVAAESVTAALAAALPAPTLPALTLASSGELVTPAVYVDGTLAATLPPPTLPALTLEATDYLPEVVLAAALPAPTLPALTLASSGELVTPAVYVDGTLAATLPPPTLPALTLEATDYLPEVVLAATLPPPTLPALALASAVVEYDQALPDAVGPGISARHLATADDPAGLWARQQEMSRIPTPVTAPAQQAAPVASGLSIGQQQMIVASRASGQRWQHGTPLANGQRAAHGDMLRHQRPILTPAQHGIALGIGARTAHQERIRLRHRLRTDQQHGIKAGTGTSAGHQHGAPLAKGVAVRQQQMIPLPLGWWQIAYPWPETPPPPGIEPSSPVALKFCRLADGTTALVFGCPTPQQPDATVVVPIRRAYIVLNSASLTRVSDGAPIPTLSLSISLDSSSWTWGFDASLPAEAQTLVEPSSGPVEVLATINGQSFRLVVESISRERRFGQVGVRISGRGRNAILDAPYSAAKSFTNTGDRTAQQLAADSLLENGVNVGLATIGEAWQVNWGLTDWLVPAGVWVHQGTHISALNAIAQAAGGYLRPDRTAATLHIEPRYPTAPWTWDAVNPDIELPSAVTIQESIQWQDKAPYNRVFVSGQQSGVLGQVTRAGTAGDTVAPMVTDALITHADAARQRGISILGDTGRVANVTLSLPVLPETGIIEVGKFVRYVDGAVTRKGIVRSSSVSVGASAVDVRQQITLETHL